MCEQKEQERFAEEERRKEEETRIMREAEAEKLRLLLEEVKLDFNLS